MKINIISDIHTEFWQGEDRIPNRPENMIVAGDICPFRLHKYGNGLLFDGDYGFRNDSLIWIAGNHEYYHNNIDEMYQKPFVKDIEGVRFICATMWASPSVVNKHVVQWGMSDFQVIEKTNIGMYSSGVRRFTVDDMIALHDKEVDFIKFWLNEPWDGKKVVVTHYLPSPIFIDEKFKYYGKGINDGYATPVIENLVKWPDVWIFGHSHQKLDRTIDGTRFISNAYGYFGYEHMNWDKNPFLEIEV